AALALARQVGRVEGAELAGDGVRGRHPHAGAVGEEGRGLEGLDLRLVGHVAAAGGQEQGGGEERHGEAQAGGACAHASTSTTLSGPRLARNAVVWRRSNLGSSLLMQT